MKTALLLIDIQNDYFENGRMPLSDSDKVCENAKFLLGKFRMNQLPVIHIQHIATRPSATFFLPDTVGAEIHEKVKPLDHEKLIIKHYPNSFRETDLLDYLKQNAITDLVVCGMMTHVCIDTTVRAAKDFGFNIVLISDACATKDLTVNEKKIQAEAVQLSFLAALSYFFSTLKTTEEYLND